MFLPMLIEAVDDEDCKPDNTKAVTCLQYWCQKGTGGQCRTPSDLPQGQRPTIIKAYCSGASILLDCKC